MRSNRNSLKEMEIGFLCCLLDCMALKVDIICSFKIPIYHYQTTQYHIPEVGSWILGCYITTVHYVWPHRFSPWLYAPDLAHSDFSLVPKLKNTRMGRTGGGSISYPKPNMGIRFVVDKVALGQVPPNTSVSPANSHSTDCCTLIVYHPGLVQ
jgi:hypothetical protein